MTDHVGHWPGDPTNRQIKFKLIDTNPDGTEVWAQIVALEPESIGGGGGGGLTDAQLRATPVPVSGTFWQAVQPVSGPLTDAQLRAVAVPVSGTFWQATQPISGSVDVTPAAPAANDYLPVRLTDGTAFYVASGGAGGTQYDEDTVSAAADKLTMAGVVRKDAAATLVDADGDRTQLQVDATGLLRVVLPAGGGGLTDAELRATPVPVSGPLTDAQLRAASVAISDGGGSLTVDGTFWQATQPVSGPLTDAQLRAVAVPVSGTFWQATQPVSGPLTDAQLRAAAVPVSGPLTDVQLRATAVPVSLASVPSHAVTGPLTNTELRAAPVVVDTKRGGTASWTWVSAQNAAPAIGAVQADTGALAAGDYEVHIHLAASDTLAVGKGLIVEHRNAANSATLHRYGACPAGGSIDIDIPRVTIALNERIRVIAGTAAGAASSFYVSSIGRRLL